MAVTEDTTVSGASAPRIFWSWQSDYAPKLCRYFIRDALVTAIEQAAAELRLDDAERPEIDHDTKGKRGMVDIAATILSKIANAALFVADLTPIAQSPEGKWLPNPNVMIELGWAMHNPGWERVIGVLNTASGAEIEDLPFDIRQRRVITYVLGEDADKTTRKSVQTKLVNEFKDALRINLEDYAEQIAGTVPISGVAAKPDNRSIWASAGATLVHGDYLSPTRRTEIGIPDVPRSYMRIIPAGWKAGTPSIAEIANLEESHKVTAPSTGGAYGDFGPTDEGYVWYWVTDKRDHDLAAAGNMLMYFEDTGEFWMLHAGAIAEHQDHYLLRDHPMLGAWSSLLRQSMRLMDRFGAQKIRRVETGLLGVKNLRWFSDFPSDRSISRRDATWLDYPSRDWGPDAQLTFLTDAYNRVTNLFARERSPEARVVEILKQFDPGRFVQTG